MKVRITCRFLSFSWRSFSFLGSVSLILVFCLIFMQKVIVKLDVSDEKSKQKAMSVVSSLSGIQLNFPLIFYPLCFVWLLRNQRKWKHFVQFKTFVVLIHWKNSSFITWKTKWISSLLMESLSDSVSVSPNQLKFVLFSLCPMENKKSPLFHKQNKIKPMSQNPSSLFLYVLYVLFCFSETKEKKKTNFFFPSNQFKFSFIFFLFHGK